MSDAREGAESPSRTPGSASTPTFDRTSGELAGPGGSTRLAPQPAALLSLLLERAGDVVDRGLIKNRLWPGGRVEFDQGIAFAVREIRKGLEQVGVDPGLVETLPRRGFRVRDPASVRWAAPGNGPEAPAPTPERAVGGSGPQRPRVPPLNPARAFRWAIRGALLTGGLALAWWVSTRGPAAAAPGAAVPAVAVFPYEPVGPVPAGGDPAALAEALTVRLTQGLAGRAGVVGPAGTADLSGPNDTEGARERLGACLAVSGSVRWPAPGTLVVFSQVVRTADRVHVWARWDTLPAERAVDLVSSSGLDAVDRALASC